MKKENTRRNNNSSIKKNQPKTRNEGMPEILAVSCSSPHFAQCITVIRMLIPMYNKCIQTKKRDKLVALCCCFFLRCARPVSIRFHFMDTHFEYQKIIETKYSAHDSSAAKLLWYKSLWNTTIIYANYSCARFVTARHILVSVRSQSLFFYLIPFFPSSGYYFFSVGFLWFFKYSSFRLFHSFVSASTLIFGNGIGVVVGFFSDPIVLL